MKLRIQLGLNLQMERRLKKMTQEELAHLAGIDRGYVGKIENAKHAATVDMIEGIAEVLEIQPMKLFRPRR